MVVVGVGRQGGTRGRFFLCIFCGIWSMVGVVVVVVVRCCYDRCCTWLAYMCAYGSTTFVA